MSLWGRGNLEECLGSVLSRAQECLEEANFHFLPCPFSAQKASQFQGDSCLTLRSWLLALPNPAYVTMLCHLSCLTFRFLQGEMGLE